jgi:hypothetical protein
MKKYFIAFASGLLLLGSSCSDSFFDKYPTDSMISDTYMTSVDEVKTVLYAAYGGMRDPFGRNVAYFGDLPTDNAYDYKLNNSTVHIELHESTVTSSSTSVRDLWESSYQIINRCNLVIDNMEEKFSGDSQFNQIVGEAKFLRAYVYYVMVRVFAGVPLVLHDIADPMDSFDVGRESVENVYKQIVLDLNDAIAKLPDLYYNAATKEGKEAEVGKATKTAAQASLADTYLTRGHFSPAKLIYEAIMAKEDGVNLGLIDGDDYRDIFSAVNVNNKEIIFAIRYGYSQTPSMSNYLGTASLPNVQGKVVNVDGYPASKVYGVNVFIMTSELEAKFAANDLRRSVVHTGIRSEEFDDPAGGKYTIPIPLTLKYFDYRNLTDGKSGNMPESGCSTIISRYADVILKYAECLNETGDPAGAIAQLKRIRDRAGLTTDITADYDAVFQAIEDERQLELCMEGHRWFDLVRTGRAQEVMNAYYARGVTSGLPQTMAIYQYGSLEVPSTVQDHELIYPIPYAQTILSPDKLLQNPNY